MFALNERLEGRTPRGIFADIKRTLYHIPEFPSTTDRIIVSPREKTEEEINNIVARLVLVDRIAGLGVYQAVGIFEQPVSKNTSPREPLPYILLATNEGERHLEEVVRNAEYPDTARAVRASSSGISGFSEKCGDFVIRGSGQTVKISSKFPDDPLISLYEFMGMHLLARQGVRTEPLLIATNYHYVAKEVEWPNDADVPDWERMISGYDVLVRRAWYQIAPSHAESERIKAFVTAHQEKPWMASFRPNVVMGSVVPNNPHSRNPSNWFTLVHAVRESILPTAW
ncbi:hypothetical protein HYT59_00210 [Candidatus Woesebacteria bacterium]|nr:hypothetical protein [Candidatus Woesebacteria bacterium]